MSTEPTAPAAAPTPTEAPSVKSPNHASEVLASLSSEELASWKGDGKLPERVTAPAPAAADEDAPAVDATGQQIRGTDGKFVSRRQQKINDSISRGVEAGIATERQARQAAEQRLRELEARQPAAEPAKPAAVPPKADTEPTLDDFLDQPDPYMAYSRALARWEVKQELKSRDTEHQTRTAQEQQHQAVIDRLTAHGAREQAIKATVPDYDAKTLAVREQLDIRSPLTLAVLESPVSEKVILHLAEHPEDFQRIGALGSTNLPAALREIGRLEAKFDTPAPAAAVAPKTVSSAPPPPPALGTRPAEPADAKVAALARKDFRAYAAEADRADLAAVRR